MKQRMIIMSDLQDLEIPENINAQINETLGIEEEKVENYVPIYKMYGENKIPVSKAEGKLWHTRQKQGLKVMEDVTDQWDLAYKYFNADQIDFNERGEVEFRNSAKLRKTHKNSQNLVWCNNISLIPALYSQDPTIEVTNNKDKDEYAQKQSTMLERLINVLFKKKSAPGLHIKKKVRKAILNTLLTNRGIIKIGWTFQIDGTERALQEMEVLSQQLTEAKDVKEIKELEQALKEITKKIDKIKKEKYNYFKGIYKGRVHFSFIKKVMPKTLMLLTNELLWSLGLTLILSCYGIRGLDFVASFNICNTISNVFITVGTSLGNATAIILGNKIGKNDLEGAKSDSYKILFFAVTVSFVFS